MATAKAAEGDAVVSGKVVKYVGTADVREINAASWRQAGVDDQDMVRWEKKNKWQVAVADLSKKAVAYLENEDSGFVITDADT